MAADITTGLQAKYACQDHAASTAVVAAVGTNATLTNAGNTSASSVTGPNAGFPRALSLDGVNDFILGPSIQGPQLACSMSAWVKPTGVGTYVVMSLYSNGTPDAAYSQFYLNGGAIVAVIAAGSGGTPTPYIGRTTALSIVLANVWSHIAFTWSGGITNASIKIYLNGVQVDDADSGSGVFAAPNASSINLRIGAQDFSGVSAPFAGAVAGVYLFSRTLPIADVVGLVVEGTSTITQNIRNLSQMLGVSCNG